MKLEFVREIVGKTPHMNFEEAKKVSEFIQYHSIRDILELGFRHGVSTCYMAATLHAIGSGHITTIDLEVVRSEKPNIEQLLEECKLTGFVDFFFEPTCYNWRLMKLLEEGPSPRYDFCFLDGAHDWFVDGFAFFLVDKLLRPGGWIIFDDIDWTYAKSPTLRNSPKVKSMPVEEKVTPGIRRVYELLVKPHPNYGDFMVDGKWAYAHKVSGGSDISARSFVKEIVVQKVEVGIGGALTRAYRKLRNFL